MATSEGFPDLRRREDVQSYLLDTARCLGVELDDEALAVDLDRRDVLADFRSYFHVPTIGQLVSEGDRSPGMNLSSLFSWFYFDV